MWRHIRGAFKKYMKFYKHFYQILKKVNLKKLTLKVFSYFGCYLDMIDIDHKLEDL